MRAIVILAVLLTAVIALAVIPTGETKVVADAWVDVSGATHVEALGDGEARVSFYSRTGGGWTTNWTRRPRGADPDTCVWLQEGAPRSFSYIGGIDSVYVDLVDATYVILSWR